MDSADGFFGPFKVLYSRAERLGQKREGISERRAIFCNKGSSTDDAMLTKALQEAVQEDPAMPPAPRLRRAKLFFATKEGGKQLAEHTLVFNRPQTEFLRLVSARLPDERLPWHCRRVSSGDVILNLAKWG